MAGFPYNQPLRCGGGLERGFQKGERCALHLEFGAAGAAGFQMGFQGLEVAFGELAVEIGGELLFK